MKVVLTGWFIVKAALITPQENTYIFSDPKKHVDLLVNTRLKYDEGAWVQIQSIAKCDRQWSETELYWESFCEAETFEEQECKIQNIFPINGIIYC